MLAHHKGLSPDRALAAGVDGCADRARQALDELEAALERGDRDRVEDALEQARGALRG